MAKGDLKSQLGSFVRGALAQLDTVREVVVHKAEAGKIQLDVAMLRRKRREVLVELGEIVAQLAAEEKITEEVFPEIGPALARLADVDDRIAAEEERARQVASGAEDDEEYRYARAEADDADEVAPEGEEDLDSGQKGE